MRIKKIHVRNFRKFLQPVTIADLSPGVCVIAGDNEEGKSTIVHAIRSAFHLKYSTTATQQIQPYNSSAMPEVAVDFELNGTTYHLRKVFGKKGSAELRSDTCVFAGSEAEEKLQELCNLGSDKKESSIWNVLWVEQGTTFGEMKVGDTGKRTLQSALERELGSIVGGDEGQLLFKQVKELYSKWYTGTGKDYKHSEFKQAEETLQGIDAQLQEAETHLQELQTMLNQLEEVRSKLRTHEEQKTLDAAHKHLDSLLSRKLEIDKQQQEYRQCEQLERTELAQHQAAANAWKQRNVLAKEVEAVATRIKDIEKNIREATEKHQLASKKLHEFQQKRADLEAAYEAALSECQAAEQLEQLRQLHKQVAELESVIERARNAEEQCKQIRKQGEAIKIDKAGLDALRQTDRQLVQCEAQLQAVATKVELRPQVGAPESLLITERTILPIQGWGEVVISPGGGDLEKLKSNTQRLKSSLAEELSKLGVASLAEAEAKEREKDQLRLEYQSFHRDLQKLAPAGIPALQDELAVLKARYEESAASSSGNQLSIFDLNQSAEKLEKARIARDAAKSELNKIKQAAEQCEKDFRDADVAVHQLSTQKNSAQDELSRLQERLAAERNESADEALFQLTKETELRLQSARQKRLELEQLLKALNADAIDAEISNAQKSIDALTSELQQLRQDQSRLEGSLQTLGKTGITEEVERLRGKKEQAEAQYRRTSLKARAVRLLHDTLSRAESSSKQQLAEPLLRRLQPYISDLFSGSKFEFDNSSFGIVQLERQTSEPVQGLSLGTREQISVLTRLAFAEVLSEAGAPAVVILDDALVYSDEARFRRMQEVIKRAAEKFQIIVMTCRESDYTGMGVPIIKLAECVGKADVAAISSSLLLPSQKSAELFLPEQVRP